MIPDEATLIQLGTVIRDGMDRIDGAAKGTDPALFETSYRTQFAMPDGRWWRLVLTPVGGGV